MDRRRVMRLRRGRLHMVRPVMRRRRRGRTMMPGGVVIVYFRRGRDAADEGSGHHTREQGRDKTHRASFS